MPRAATRPRRPDGPRRASSTPWDGDGAAARCGSSASPLSLSRDRLARARAAIPPCLASLASRVLLLPPAILLEVAAEPRGGERLRERNRELAFLLGELGGDRVGLGSVDLRTAAVT